MHKSPGLLQGNPLGAGAGELPGHRAVEQRCPGDVLGGGAGAGKSYSQAKSAWELREGTPCRNSLEALLGLSPRLVLWLVWKHRETSWG